MVGRMTDTGKEAKKPGKGRQVLEGKSGIGTVEMGKKNEKGSITLEASIFLVIFIVFYLAIMDFIQIARAQVILQYAAAEAAREISQYSYVLTKTGIVEKRVGTSTQAAEFMADAGSLLDDVKAVGNAITDGGDVVGSIQQAGNHANEFFGAPDALMDNIFSLIKTMGADMLSDMAIEVIVEGIVEEQIENMSSKSADEYLKDLGIDGGMAGLQFDDSKWANSSSGGMPELEVSIVYTIDFHLGIFELEPRRYKVCAKTALW